MLSYNAFLQKWFQGVDDVISFTKLSLYLLQYLCILVYLHKICNYLFLRRDCLYLQNIEDHYLYMQRFNKNLKATWNLKMVAMILVLTQPIFRLGHLHGKILLMTLWTSYSAIAWFILDPLKMKQFYEIKYFLIKVHTGLANHPFRPTLWFNLHAFGINLVDTSRGSASWIMLENPSTHILY